jgi:hypothetical protein
MVTVIIQALLQTEVDPKSGIVPREGRPGGVGRSAGRGDEGVSVEDPFEAVTQRAAVVRQIAAQVDVGEGEVAVDVGEFLLDESQPLVAPAVLPTPVPALGRLGLQRLDLGLAFRQFV